MQHFSNSHFLIGSETAAHNNRLMRIVAVTACPTGIAHTYMAAERLAEAARKLRHAIKVETQGALGIENELSQADIDAAEVAILATDIAIERPARFVRIRKVRVPVQDALKDPVAVLLQAQAT